MHTRNMCAPLLPRPPSTEQQAELNTLHKQENASTTPQRQQRTGARPHSRCWGHNGQSEMSIVLRECAQAVAAVAEVLQTKPTRLFE